MARTLTAVTAVAAFASCLAAQQHPLRVPAQAQERKLIDQPAPDYPPLAKQARIQGAVELAVWIGADGHVKEIRLIKGHPFLVRAAMEAVKCWRYAPTYSMGRAVEVVTIVTVNFTLSPDPPHQPGGEQAIIHV
jgi:protein TonB